MAKTYYVFQKNKVIIDTRDASPQPLDGERVKTLGLESLCQLGPEITGDSRLNIINYETGDLPENYAGVDLRSLLGRADDHHFHLWGKAAQLLHWYEANRFCGRCGGRTTAHPHEIARFCTDCNASYYPRISPCIIVLIHRRDRILLARSPRFPRSLYSTLAGFIEPGETAEEAVKREIYEEVRLEVKNIRYFKSQPWPFPGQLMLGFFAEYASGEIVIDEIEICEAAWYNLSELPKIPVRETIAGQLIRHYRKNIIA